MLALHPHYEVDFSQWLQLCHPKMKSLQYLHSMSLDDHTALQHDLQLLPALTDLKLVIDERDWDLEDYNQVHKIRCFDTKKQSVQEVVNDMVILSYCIW